MATIAEQIEALENAIAAGSRVIEYDGKKEEFRSLTDMMRTLDYLKKKQNKPTRNLRGFNPICRKGL